MLPGFRFLFAAIVLSVSILVFGFGAAALLRTAHEEFANTPTWQPAPETRFAQGPESPTAAPPVLAMLRVEDPPKDASNELAKADQPASREALTTGAADQAAVAADPITQPDNIAALQPAISTPTEAAKPEAGTSEAPVTDGAPQATAPADAPADPDASKLVTSEPVLAEASEATPAPAAGAVAAAPEQPNASPRSESNPIETKIATLGGPPVPIAVAAAKAASPKPNIDVAKKRHHARRETRHRRSAHRARSARPTQALDPFGQPTATATR